MALRVEFKAKDGANIVGDFYKAADAGAVLLLHMMPSDRKSWAGFAGKLQEIGISSLAIDLRGHGESQGGPAGFKSFTDKEHQASIEDVEAGILWLRNNGFKKIALVGASIGANLALWYAAEHADKSIKSAILLSPGLDYRGIKTESLTKQISPDQNIYFVADENDMRSAGSSAASMAQHLYELTTGAKKIRIFKEGLHGTDILHAHPDLEEELIKWLKENV